MFRLNLVLRHSRTIPRSMLSCRRYCTPKALNEKLKGKVYVIDLKKSSKCDEVLSKEISEQKSLRKFEQQEFRDDQWKRLVCVVNEIFENYKTLSADKMKDKMKELRIQETLNSLKTEFNAEKLKEKFKDPKFKEIVNKETLKQVAGMGIEQWQTIKTSEGYAKIRSFPSTTVTISKEMIVKAQDHWVVFNQSPTQQKIVHVVAIFVENVKRGITEVFKFIKFVLDAPNGPKK